MSSNSKNSEKVVSCLSTLLSSILLLLPAYSPSNKEIPCFNCCLCCKEHDQRFGFCKFNK
ncbi:hypothetical protein Bca4012_003308 [Brassica carinata]